MMGHSAYYERLREIQEEELKKRVGEFQSEIKQLPFKKPKENIEKGDTVTIQDEVGNTRRAVIKYISPQGYVKVKLVD